MREARIALPETRPNTREPAELSSWIAAPALLRPLRHVLYKEPFKLIRTVYSVPADTGARPAFSLAAPPCAGTRPAAACSISRGKRGS